MEHVVGPQKQIATICIGPRDDMETRRKEISQAIRDVDSGDGVIILSDLFGGTPSNLAISLLDVGKADPAGKRAQEYGRIRSGFGRTRCWAQIYQRRIRSAGGIAVSRVSRSLTIVNQKGLHARASAKFVTFVSRLPDGLKVDVEKDGQSVAGTSIMGLMMLGAAKGSSITIHVEGEEAEMALEKLAGLVTDGFGED
jgi:phosphocarrier protein